MSKSIIGLSHLCLNLLFLLIFSDCSKHSEKEWGDDSLADSTSEYVEVEPYDPNYKESDYSDDNAALEEIPSNVSTNLHEDVADYEEPTSNTVRSACICNNGQCGVCFGSGRCGGCYGNGMIYSFGDYVDCSCCGGSGRCPSCEGSGICPYCEGRGFTETEF